MSRITPFAFGLALPLTLVSHAALADLTPAEVWADWRQYMESVGYKIEASESYSGSDLTVSGINFSLAVPEGGGDMQMSMGSIEFKQNNDGTVAIILPNVMPISLSSMQPAGNGQAVDIDMTLTQSGHAMTASGAPNNLSYAYTADTVKMDVDQEVSADNSAIKDNVKATLTATDVSNDTTMVVGETRSYEQSSSIASATYTMNIDTPSEGGQKGTITGTVSGITIGGSGTMPLVVPDMADMPALLAAGFAISGKIAYASGSSNFDVQNPRDGDFKMQTTTQGGTLDVAVGADGLAYSGAQQDLKMAVNVAAMPFPIELAMAESGFNLALPVEKKDEDQDFAFGITLGNFTMSDLLWGLFDAQGQLPRDPATIKLDLTGKAKVLVDYLIPQNVANIDGPQATVKALKLNTLLVDAAGAKLEGTGDVTFDGQGPSMIPGVGTPVGGISLDLAGANGLIDKLSAMGLLPQEQAMGARMMMGVFAVPGDGPDTLKSKIDFTQDGQILANGQRIR